MEQGTLVAAVGGWARIRVAAKYAGVCERTFRSWFKEGLVHSRLPSGMVLVRYSDVDAFLEDFRADQGVEIEAIDRLVEEVIVGPAGGIDGE